MTMSLSVVSMLFSSTASSSGSGLTAIATGTGSTSATSTASAGTIQAALVMAQKNEAKQLAQVAKDPQVQKELARYEKVVKNAESIDDVLNDPVARKVLMTATGLRSDIDNIGLAKRAMLSSATDSKSVAAQLSSIKGGWIDFVKTYDLAKYGVDRLAPKQDGFEARWRVELQRNDEPLEAMLEISRYRGGWQATVDGVAVPISVDGDDVTIDMIWYDSDDELHTTRLRGTLDGDSMSGVQADDGVDLETEWNASLYFKDTLAEISKNYIAEKRLDLLDQQMPGLGSAVLFKQVASSLKDATDVLASGLGREVITTAFNIPKQIAIQSMVAQEKAIAQRVDFSRLQNPAYVDVIAQRYLLMLNGGLGGITV